LIDPLFIELEQVFPPELIGDAGRDEDLDIDFESDEGIVIQVENKVPSSFPGVTNFGTPDN
jgi:hypothetical protein